MARLFGPYRMKPDSEVARRLEAARKAHSIVAVQAEHEPHHQTAEQREEFSYQLHVLDCEIKVLAWWLDPSAHQQSSQSKLAEAAKILLGKSQGAYSAILNEAERDQENQTTEEHNRYRYHLHGLATETGTIQWLLDLNAHSQPTGEHLVREANSILNPPTSPQA